MTVPTLEPPSPMTVPTFDSTSPMTVPTLNSESENNPTSWSLHHWYYDDDNLLPLNADDENLDSSRVRTPSSIASNHTSTAGMKSISKFQRMLKGKNNRNSIQGAHIERQCEEEFKAIRKSLYKVGTTLWNTVSCGENNLEVFSTAEKCADAMNRAFGVDGLTGYALQHALKVGNIGKSPPRKGAPRVLPEIIHDNLCIAFYTMNAIDQANCTKALNRQELMSLATKIVNTKLESNIDGVHLYKTIEKRLSRKQELRDNDPREARRVQWLTYSTQKKHYENWETFLVEDGFARLPENTEEQENAGHVIFFGGMDRFVVNYDEMDFSLCGKGQERTGRPSKTPTSTALPASGHKEDKSSRNVTLCVGFNMADELLPIFIIFPSKAKEENHKMAFVRATHYHQIPGRWGLQREHTANCEFGFSLKGGMTASLHRKYHEKILRPLWPGVQNVVGRKCVFKADSGPGRDEEKFLFDSFQTGFVQYLVCQMGRRLANNAIRCLAN